MTFLKGNFPYGKNATSSKDLIAPWRTLPRFDALKSPFSVGKFTWKCHEIPIIYMELPINIMKSYLPGKVWVLKF